MSDQSQGPGWWQASDGRWYAPEQHPDFQADATAVSDAPTPETGPASDATAVFSSPPPVPPATPPVDPGPPPSAGGYPPGPPIAGAPPFGGDAPGMGGDDGSGKKKSKAPLIIALVVLVLVILGVGGFFLLSGGDGDDEKAEPKEDKKEEPEEEGQPATEEGLENAATGYAEALLADDAGTAYLFVSEECQDIITRGEYEDIFADITESLEESEVDLGDIEVDSVDISDFSEESASASVLLDGLGDFPATGYVALPQEWTYDGGRWQVPGCDGVVLGWYTLDEVGFTTATVDFHTESLTGDVALTYPFLAAECRDEIDLDTFVETYEEQLADAEQALDIDFSDILLTDVTDVEIDGDEGQGTPEFDIPSDIITALEELDAAEDFENPEPITAVYEGGIWRTTDCASYSPEGTSSTIGEIPPEDDETLNPIEGAIIPLSQVARVGNWDVKVTSFEENANATIAAADPSNPTPFSGNQYVVVGLEVTYRGEGTSTAFDFSFAGLNGAGEDNSFYGACGTVPNALDDTATVAKDQTITGNICFDVPIGDVPSFQLQVEDFFSDADPSIFLVR
jgi:hypothetical protein